MVSAHSDLVIDALDLSFTEMLILQLLKYNQGVQRSILLETVNTFIKKQNQTEEGIAPSSFYHRLDRLAKQGYVEFLGSGKGTRSILSERGDLLLKEIRKFSFLGSVDFIKETQDLARKFLEHQPMNSFENTLIISMEEVIDPRIFNTLYTNFRDKIGELFILADTKQYQHFLQRGLDPFIKQTDIDQNRIRDFDNKYDGVIIIGFDQNSSYLGKQTEHWVEESYRVTKTGGYILMNCLEDIPAPDHIVIKNLIEEIRESIYFKMVSASEVEELLYKYNLNNIERFSSHGVLILYGQK